MQESIPRAPQDEYPHWVTCSQGNLSVDIVPRPGSSESHPILPQRHHTFPVTWCRTRFYGRETPACTGTIPWSAVNSLWAPCYEIMMLNCETSDSGKQRDWGTPGRRDSWMRKMKNIFTFSKTAYMREPVFPWFDRIMYFQDNIRFIQFKDQKVHDVHLLRSSCCSCQIPV